MKKQPHYEAIRTLDDLAVSVSVRKHAHIDFDEECLEIEREIAMIRQRHANVLETFQAIIDVETARQLAYLKEHKADFDGPPRSIEFCDGTVGYRLGKEHLEPLSKWTWSKVLAKCLTLGNTDLIRNTPSVDRENILANKDFLGKDGLAVLGLKLVQEDAPFVDIKRDDIDPATAAGGEVA